MNSEILAILALNQILNLFVFLLLWRFLKSRLRGPTGHKGDQGMRGDRGSRGKSAYELALDYGFKGTLEEFIEAISGGKKLK